MDNVLKCHEILEINFVQGKNCHLYDEGGRKYTDLESGIWCTILGHCHPRINQAMQAQLKQVMHLGARYPNALVQQAAEDVLGILGMPGGKCVFLSSGSEAVEFSVQAARRIAHQKLLLTFASSYLAAYGSAGRKNTHEWLSFDWGVYTHTAKCDPLEGIPFNKIGGFVFEPGGSGPGFVKFPPQRLVQEIAHKVKENAGLLVVNEVTTGMGRTGKWFGFQHYDLQPDIVALGKGLGNGYPVSAVALRRETAEALENSGLHYVQSHQNDPLGCAVAWEVIAELRDGDWIEKGRKNGAFFLGELKKLKKHAVVKEARGRGMLLALEFHPDERISAESAFRAVLEKGFLVGYYPAGNILRFDPPLTIARPDITRLVECLDSFLDAV